MQAVCARSTPRGTRRKIRSGASLPPWMPIRWSSTPSMPPASGPTPRADSLSSTPPRASPAVRCAASSRTPPAAPCCTPSLTVDHVGYAVTLTVPALDSQDFAFTTAVYDLEIEDADGVVSTLLTGAVEVTEEVTTP